MSPKEKPLESWVKKSILDEANLVHAMSYIPYGVGALAMYFLGNTEKKAALHHIKYSAMIAVAAIVCLIILNDFFWYILNLAYIVLSVYFGWRAYNGQEVEVEFLDVIEDKITETIKK